MLQCPDPRWVGQRDCRGDASLIQQKDTADNSLISDTFCGHLSIVGTFSHSSFSRVIIVQPTRGLSILKPLQLSNQFLIEAIPSPEKLNLIGRSPRFYFWLFIFHIFIRFNGHFGPHSICRAQTQPSKSQNQAIIYAKCVEVLDAIIVGPMGKWPFLFFLYELPLDMAELWCQI